MHGSCAATRAGDRGCRSKRRPNRARTLAARTAACALAALAVGAAQETLDPSEAIARTGAYVERYFAAIRTVTAREEVVLQPLDGRLQADGPERTIVYIVRVEWMPEPGVVTPPRVQRRIVTIDGRPARGADDACLAAESDDPLAFLLSPARDGYVFGPVRRTGGKQPRLAIDYAPAPEAAAPPPSLVWHGDCGTFHLPGRISGRVLVEPGTFAVRRIESRLERPVDVPVPPEARKRGWGASVRAELVDASIDYEPVAFEDPDETLLLPAMIRRVTVVRTPEPRRLRVTQRFSRFERFVTGIRVLPGTRQPQF